MPQAPRKDASAQKAQDKESKRARGALSCAECRRLKLKCDKTVPCSSCKRRGCSAICPNGSLKTGQGTRFVLADTEKLHSKISQMSDRIRQLEDALAVAHSTSTKEQHPLLTRDLLKIKSSLELHSAVDYEEKEGSSSFGQDGESEDSQYIDAFGTLAIRDDGAATFYGRSAGSESLLIRELPPDPPSQGSTPDASGQSVNTPQLEPYLPPEVAALASNFPLASALHRPGVDLDYIVDSYLPTWEQASRLVEHYLESAPWFFGAVTRRQLDEELLPMWYKEAPRPAVAPSPVAGGTSSAGDAEESSSNKANAHDLALLFVMFCFGSLTDMEMPPSPNNPEAEHYFQLTKACLTIEPVLDRPPGVSTVQTLSMMAIYEGLCSKPNSIETTWALFGMATKMAQSIGLHRDCARWKLSPGEVQKRRALFWELFITDCWQSLATGRLATFSLPFVDCELPSDPDQTMAEDGTPQPSFPSWKARFGAECVSAVVQGTLTSRAPKYSIILELDRKVRDVELPAYAQGAPPHGAGLAETMSHFMPTNYRELTLLYIHRCFFAHALSNNSADPIKSQYAPSFFAGYRSACTILNSVKQQFTLFPAQISRFWVLWTHAFSASIMIGSVVKHNPKCKVAPAALLELRNACDLFERAASYGGRATKFLPILKRLQSKAQQVYRETNAGAPQRIPNDIFRPSNLKQEEEDKDELLIFSGKTQTVTTKTTSTHSVGNSPSGNPSAKDTDSNPSSPSHMFADNPSFANVHPSLANELNLFDGHIQAQIQSAYQQGGDVFGPSSSAMVVDPPLPDAQRAVPPPLPASSSSSQADPMGDHREVLQHQQQEHQQQFLQQMEQQRQEMERIEMGRQQQLLQEQQAALRQEQMRRQQLEQRQDQYRQLELQRQMEEQQRRQHQHQQSQRIQPPHSHRSSGEYTNSPYAPAPDSYAPPASSVAGPSHSLHRIPARAPSTIHQTMQQQQHPPPVHQMHQSQYQSMSRGHLQTLPATHHHQGLPSAALHQQQPYAPPPASNSQLYTLPPAATSEYGHSPPPTAVSANGSSLYPPAPPIHDSHGSMAMTTTSSSSHPQQHHHHSAVSSTMPSPHSGPLSAHSSDGGYHQYWPAAPTAYNGGPGQQRYMPANPQVQHQHQQQNYHHYTPEGALRGIAAEDPRLQETWQSYMTTVGSPRLFDD